MVLLRSRRMVLLRSRWLVPVLSCSILSFELFHFDWHMGKDWS